MSDASGATMRILVTGATGFIGSRLCADLRAAGHEPVGLSRDPARAPREVPALAAAFGWLPTAGPPRRPAWRAWTPSCT